ncbi:hypothetical protein [Pontibacter akesuensis]|uniref:Uncharacterized protein n=1 Tax=Pontibacter akesuensis TaxID=388950 RepID=A0A1I7JN90_9BACT|nr:hypothetical protein [Pontibacter akesuensis]GHA68727.1 hypothetical protein GCM10007389_22170 [Pontibacter akesuensis]SFU86637.1 hypothetical protein SAMN04487941_3057 [Pontibacter akesuensis]
MLTAYYRFESLPESLRLQHKIRSKARLDCTAYANPKGYTGLMDFINPKGQMYLYKTPAREIVKANSKRLAEWALGNGKLNLSSIYFEDADYPECSYGYPNANRLLSSKEPNPLFPYRNDCYLFLTNADLTLVEVLVVLNGRNLVSGYYQNLIDGGLDKELQHLREQASPLFSYESAL